MPDKNDKCPKCDEKLIEGDTAMICPACGMKRGEKPAPKKVGDMPTCDKCGKPNSDYAVSDGGGVWHFHERCRSSMLVGGLGKKPAPQTCGNCGSFETHECFVCVNKSKWTPKKMKPAPQTTPSILAMENLSAGGEIHEITLSSMTEEQAKYSNIKSYYDTKVKTKKGSQGTVKFLITMIEHLKVENAFNVEQHRQCVIKIGQQSVKISNLEADLKEANFYRKELGERVDGLEAQLKARDEDIARLKALDKRNIDQYKS
jgi:hypothetical protein